MPIDPVKIPQNVQIEDKVVGPLSLRQIIIITIGGGFSYMLYSLVQRTYGHVSIPLAIALWSPAAIAAAFAVVHINDLSLLRICFLLLERMQKPSQRVWAPRTGIAITIRTSPKKDDDSAKKMPPTPEPSTEDKIAALSTVVDSAVIPGVAAQPPTIAADITASPEMPTAIQAPAEDEDLPSDPPTPVNPDRIQVDLPHPAPAHLSDLSVFRDIFPPTTTWQA